MTSKLFCRLSALYRKGAARTKAEQAEYERLIAEAQAQTKRMHP